MGPFSSVFKTLKTYGIDRVKGVMGSPISCANCAKTHKKSILLVIGQDVPWLSIAFFLWMSLFEDLVNMLVLEERVPCGCRLAHD